MSADFRFKRFVVSQGHAPMKVGTDGVLLGAWAEGGKRILDVGTGTGLIALMMAQRYETAMVTGIEINGDAIKDAVGNAANSPFAERVEIVGSALQDWVGRGFDAVVCNPPFFVRSLKCPDEGRRNARHAETLTTSDLVGKSWDIMDDGGRLSVILPYEQEGTFIHEAEGVGFALSRIMRVRPMENAGCKRIMIEMRKNVEIGEVEEREMFIEKARHIYSEEYKNMTKEFYLDK
ncbi:MAG: methyltransferase [Paludibacteraceae bacterium]|nr:methyltransferase [Paludibacteraceae bacterium]